ncbi:hypothetical protein ILUMI_12369, partial [Ignelater luminosus]
LAKTTPAVTASTSSALLVSCYGCGKTGFIKSNCPSCKKSPSTQPPEFYSIGCHLKLADGKPRYEDVLFTYLDVYLHGRRIPTKFLVFSTATCNNTLLGMDFIEDARLVFNFKNKTWRFVNDPGMLYPLQYEASKPESDSSIDINFITSIRPDGGQLLEEAEKQKVNDFLENCQDIIDVWEEPAPFSKLVIETGNHLLYLCLLIVRKELLRQELNKLLQ